MSILIMKGVIILVVKANLKWKSLLVNIAVPLLTGGIAALITRDGFKEYDNIIQPSLSPPSWLFPIAWTILYVLMGISTYLIYEKDKTLNKPSLIIYAIQLAVNFIWPIFFFGFNAYLFSFILLIKLVIFVITMIIFFYKENKLAGLLQIPYFLWLLFAAYLNLSVYLLN